MHRFKISAKQLLALASRVVAARLVCHGWQFNDSVCPSTGTCFKTIKPCAALAPGHRCMEDDDADFNIMMAVAFLESANDTLLFVAEFARFFPTMRQLNTWSCVWYDYD